MTKLKSKLLFSWTFYQVKNMGYLHEIWWKKMFCAKKVTKLPDLTVPYMPHLDAIITWNIAHSLGRLERWTISISSFIFLLKIFFWQSVCIPYTASDRIRIWSLILVHKKSGQRPLSVPNFMLNLNWIQYIFYQGSRFGTGPQFR